MQSQRLGYRPRIIEENLALHKLYMHQRRGPMSVIEDQQLSSADRGVRCGGRAAGQHLQDPVLLRSQLASEWGRRLFRGNRHASGPGGRKPHQTPLSTRKRQAPKATQKTAPAQKEGASPGTPASPTPTLSREALSPPQGGPTRRRGTFPHGARGGGRYFRRSAPTDT